MFLVDPSQTAVGSLHRLQGSCKRFQLIGDDTGLWIRQQSVHGRSQDASPAAPLCVEFFLGAALNAVDVEFDTGAFAARRLAIDDSW